MNALEMIAAAAAAPKTHAVITTYANGAKKQHDTRSEATAENWAHLERQKIGRDLIDRATMTTVRVVSVEIIKL